MHGHDLQPDPQAHRGQGGHPGKQVVHLLFTSLCYKDHLDWQFTRPAGMYALNSQNSTPDEIRN